VAIEYSYEILGQPSMIANRKRKLNFYFSESGNGINNERKESFEKDSELF